MTKKIGLLIFSFSVLCIISCSVDPKIAAPVNDLQEIIPPGFPNPVYTFSTNVISKDRFILGRALFYDPILSADNTISCGTCHQSDFAFANYDHPFSHGIHDLFGKRNAPALFNLAWHPYFMQDGAVNNIEVQPIAPICNPIEMGENMVDVVEKLQASAKFKALFRKAYGSDTVSTVRMLHALTQFMGLMYSYNSKYDYFKRSENNVTFNAQELSGYNLFIANCSSCHKEPLFTDFEFRNNGLSVHPVLQDSGRAHVTLQQQDLYKFKTPSLRNIAVTEPYMHDGRYTTLEDCIDHYRSGTKPTGIINRVNLDPLLRDSLKLSEQDKADIISFLRTLTDYGFVTDSRFADPRLPN